MPVTSQIVSSSSNSLAEASPVIGITGSLLYPSHAPHLRGAFTLIPFLS